MPEPLRLEIELVPKNIRKFAKQIEDSINGGGSSGGGKSGNKKTEKSMESMTKGIGDIALKVGALLAVTQMWGFFLGSMKALLKIISLILKPIGDIFGGVFLTLIRTLLPVAKLLNLMMRPFLKNMMTGIGNAFKSGGGVQEAFSVVMVEGAKMIAVLLSEVLLQVMKISMFPIELMTKLMLLALGGVAILLSGIYDAITGGTSALDAKVFFANILGFASLEFGAMEAGTTAVIRSFQQYLMDSSSVTTANNNLAISLSFVDELVKKAAYSLDYEFGVMVESALYIATAGKNAMISAANDMDLSLGAKMVIISGQFSAAYTSIQNASNLLKATIIGKGSLEEALTQIKTLTITELIPALEAFEQEMKDLRDIAHGGGVAAPTTPGLPGNVGVTTSGTPMGMPPSAGIGGGYTGTVTPVGGLKAIAPALKEIKPYMIDPAADRVIETIVQNVGTTDANRIAKITQLNDAIMDVPESYASQWLKRNGYQAGGNIPSTGMYMMHKGEEVIPASRRTGGGGGGVSIGAINVYSNSSNTRDLVRDIGRELQYELRRVLPYGQGV